MLIVPGDQVREREDEQEHAGAAGDDEREQDAQARPERLVVQRQGLVLRRPEGGHFVPDGVCQSPVQAARDGNRDGRGVAASTNVDPVGKFLEPRGDQRRQDVEVSPAGWIQGHPPQLGEVGGDVPLGREVRVENGFDAGQRMAVLARFRVFQLGQQGVGALEDLVGVLALRGRLLGTPQCPERRPGDQRGQQRRSGERSDGPEGRFHGHGPLPGKGVLALPGAVVGLSVFMSGLPYGCVASGARPRFEPHLPLRRRAGRSLRTAQATCQSPEPVRGEWTPGFRSVGTMRNLPGSRLFRAG
jgi:hypothetical protein